MSEALGEGIAGPGGHILGQDSRVDVEELVDVLAGFTGMAAVVEDRVADELVLVAWEALARLTSSVSLGDNASRAVEVIGESGVDVVELVECVGADALGDAAEWAFKALNGDVEPRPGAVDALASCMGWIEEPGRLPPLTAAAAIVVALNAAFNRYIASRGLVSG